MAICTPSLPLTLLPLPHLCQLLHPLLPLDLVVNYPLSHPLLFFLLLICCCSIVFKITILYFLRKHQCPSPSLPLSLYPSSFHSCFFCSNVCILRVINHGQPH